MGKYLTLNTHSWLEEDMLVKMEQLANHILDEGYDVICLQEVNQALEGKEQISDNYTALPTAPHLHSDHYGHLLVKYLATKGLTYYWSWSYNHIGYDRYHEGVAILSKNPLEAVEEVLVSDSDDTNDYHTRKVLVSKTKVDNQLVTIASCHLSWYGKGFEEEWHRLESYLKQVNGPIIIMGDFNNPVAEAGYHLILSSSLQLQDSHQAADSHEGDYTIVADIAGWEGNTKALKVDHAFVSKEIVVQSSRVVLNGKDSPIISDHYGLAVEAMIDN